MNKFFNLNLNHIIFNSRYFKKFLYIYGDASNTYPLSNCFRNLASSLPFPCNIGKYTYFKGVIFGICNVLQG